MFDTGRGVMTIIGCDETLPLSGSGNAFWSYSNTPATAIATALDQAQREADLLARAEALKHDCRNECPEKVVSAATMRVTRSYSTWARLGDLAASLFWGEWKYSGHVEFDWSASVSCAKRPGLGQQPPAEPQVHPTEKPFTAEDLELIGEVGQLRVTDPASGAALADIPVRYQVAAGPFRFAEDAQSIIVRTGRDGVASVKGRFTAPGVSTLIATLADTEGPDYHFRGYTAGFVHDLTIETRSCFEAEAGRVEIRIMASDWRGSPVSGADLLVEGSYDYRQSRTIVEGRVTPAAEPGAYVALLETSEAGALQIYVEDRATKASTYAWVHVLPGVPAEIRILAPVEPRSAPPYRRAEIVARLVDRFGNPLAASRLRCAVEGADLVHAAVTGPQARFTLERQRSGTASATLSDMASSIELFLEVPFAVAWIGRPGVVFQGDEYLTPVYLSPEPDSVTATARLHVEFDPAQVSFGGFSPVAGASSRVMLAPVEGNRLSLDIVAEQPLAGLAGDDGLYLGDLRWNCQAKGLTCFQSSAELSPESSKFEMCLPQKARLGIACICVNLIHPPENKWKDPDVFRRALQRIEDEAKALGAFVTANVVRCCPFVAVSVSRTALSEEEYARILGIVGPSITSSSDSQKFANPRRFPNEPIEAGIKENCINMYLYPFSKKNPNYRERGDTFIGPVEGHTTGRAGRGVIDPFTATAAGHNLPHELGHALGLTHASALGERYNLMAPSPPRGTNLNEAQCRTLFDHVDYYPCLGGLLGGGSH